MTTRTYHIEFLTPCFGAGANQAEAELRPSEIRGMLRWWFRALGGTAIEERKIFGGVHGDNSRSSTIAIRILERPTGGQTDWHMEIPEGGTAPEAYLLGFFCSRTGRLNSKGALPPGSKAIVQVLFKQPPAGLLEKTLKIFFSIGALGFRATRAAGALTSREYALTKETWKEVVNDLKNARFNVELIQDEFNDWSSLIHKAGNILKNKLRSSDGLGISAGQNGSSPNALGSAEPRQASVLQFRPVRIDGNLRLALLEAPHQHILGTQALRVHANRGSILELAKERKLI